MWRLGRQVFGLALDDEKAGVTAPPTEAAYAIADLAAGNSDFGIIAQLTPSRPISTMVVGLRYSLRSAWRSPKLA